MQWHAGRACAWRMSASACAGRPANAQRLAGGVDCPQCVPGLDCRSALGGEDEARLHPDRGRLEPLDCLARLDPPKSATVAGERGTLRGERSVLGSLMTRCPLARESVPRTRRVLLVRSTSDQRRASVSPWLRPVGRAGASVAHTRLGNGDVVPSCPRHTCRLTLAAGLLASSSASTAVSSPLWPRWAGPTRRSANYARSSGSPGRPSTGTSQ